jgi:hypothetical protein
MTDLHVGTTASGVPVVHRSRPGDAQIALVFGSGQDSASIASAGLPHLVEHVVMRGVGVPVGEHNAVTERDAMTFFAGGAPHQLRDFVAAVTASIRRVAAGEVSELHRDVAAIDAEMGINLLPTAGPLARRFGYHGQALAEFGAPTIDRMSPEHVVDWVCAHLHRDNAALLVLGEVDLDLDIDLPPAPEGWARAVEAAPDPLTERSWAWSEAAPLALSFDVAGDWPVSAFLGTLLESSIMSELRHDRSLIYSVMSEYLSHTRELRTLAMYLDPQPAQSTQALGVLLELLDRHAAGSFDPGLLERTRSRLLDDLGSEGGRDAHAAATALSLAWRRPRTDAETAIEMVRDLGAGELAAALRPVAEGLVVTVNGASGGVDDATAEHWRLTTPTLPGADWPQRSTLTWAARGASGRTLTAKGRRGSPMAGSSLVLDDALLMITDGATGWVVDLSDTALLLRSQAGVEITTRASWSLEIAFAAWKGADVIVHRLLEIVPADRIVDLEVRLGQRPAQ